MTNQQKLNNYKNILSQLMKLSYAQRLKLEDQIYDLKSVIYKLEWDSIKKEDYVRLDLWIKNYKR
tara:strand:+ start:2196 stop:2390 length:195 start_codon:yes stop_codon:yes gene_type:complete